MKYFLTVIITVIVLVGCGGAEERKAVYLEKARLSFKVGDLDKARIELKNVLQIDPKDAQAYFQLGEIFERKKEYKKAFNNYSKAVEINPDNFDYQAKIGTYMLLLVGNFDVAIEKRDLILGKDETNVSGLLLKAGILFKQNDASGASEIAQDIFLRHPEHVQNAMFLSSLYLGDEKYEEAIDVLNACIQQNPVDVSLLNALANAYFKVGKYDLAENEFRKILKKNPEVFSNYLKLASFYQKIGSLDKAENVMRKAMEEDADDEYRKIALVDTIQKIKGNLSAIDELKSIISDNSDMSGLRLKLAKYYLAENKQDDAVKVLERIVVDFSEDSAGIKSRVYLANLYMQKNDEDAATNIINEALDISPNDAEVIFVKAKQQLQNHDYEGAIISLRTVIKDNQEHIEAYLLLSIAHKNSGEDEQANEILYRAYENNLTNTKGLIALARLYAKNENSTKLEKVVDRYLSIDSNNYEILSYKSKLLNKKEMFSEASVFASQMVKLHPDMPNGYIQSVPYMMANNRKEEAISLLEKGYDRVKDKASILEPLVSLHVFLKNYNAAIIKIQSVIRENGGTKEQYIFLAKVQVASGNVDDAKISLSKAGLDNDLKLSLGVAQIYQGLGDYNKAINEYEKTYEKYTDNVILINNLASLLVLHRNDKNSLKRAKELADKLKNNDNANILDTVGWVSYKVGAFSEAASVLKTVVKKMPDVALFNYHLGMALYKTGDEAGAKTYLTRSLADKNSFLGRENAETYLQKLQ